MAATGTVPARWVCTSPDIRSAIVENVIGAGGNIGAADS